MSTTTYAGISTSILAAAGAERAQPLVSPHPVRVAVHPIRLQGVVADGRDAAQLERRRGVVLRAAAGHAAEEVRLAAAAGAGAGAAQLFQRIVGFVAVIPHDDQHVADSLI